MKLATGNMFDHPASLILVTTNSYVRSNGTLVMGRGAAAELRRHYPEAESVFGAKVQNVAGLGIYITYGVLISPCPICQVDHDPKVHMMGLKPRYGIFQVKYHWGKPAVPELIQYSVAKLMTLAPQYESISLNYPAIGNGGLSKDTVWPLIKGLPDNVTVWEKE
jgi:hypothetical protein